MKEKKECILIACGGTGGHLYPGIAIAEEWKALGHDAVLLISEKKIDRIAAEAYPHLTFLSLPSMPLPKPWQFKMISFIKQAWCGVKQSKLWIAEYGVTKVLGMGGFTSFAPLVAGRQMKLRTAIHESNTIPGKANKLNAKFADDVICAFEYCRNFFKKARVTCLGTPIRRALFEFKSKDIAVQAKKEFGLSSEQPVLVVMGGSQGAKAINREVLKDLKELAKVGVQILHITGPVDYAEVANGYAGCDDLTSFVVPFYHEMEKIYAVADLVIARSGASTLAEIAHFQLPSILIPYPYAADDHQRVNAEEYVKGGGALMILEKEMVEQSGKLSRMMLELMNAPEKRNKMRQSLAEVSRKNPAKAICDLLLS
jgi:UDP-N-acetylglucosamine--N-acetylmuramyl-(pentapeptide) pyrophosphoryl-undecaprenol N-acetylglucosamine transferase